MQRDLGIKRTAIVIFASVLFPGLAGAQGLQGPVYPPPGGVTLSQIGSDVNGDQARGGGLTFIYQNLNFCTFPLYYSLGPGQTVASMGSGTPPMVFDALQSDLPNGRAVWSGSAMVTYADPGCQCPLTTGVGTRATLQIRDLADAPLAMILGGTVGLDLAGAVFPVNQSFKANLLFEINFAGQFPLLVPFEGRTLSLPYVTNASGAFWYDSDHVSAPPYGELAPGANGVRSLDARCSGGAVADVYKINQAPYSSYEAVVDGASGDLGPVGGGLVLERTDNALTSLQTSQAVGVGPARSLRWVNNTGSAVADQRIRVAGNGCTTNCGADDVYRIRFYDTTYAVPRFNNAGSQVTVLFIQNPTDYAVTGTVYFWSVGGALLVAQPFSLAAKGIFALNTSTVAAGTGGTMSIAHDARYGDLTGKTVALEPATGFSFDTPLVPRTP